MKLLDCFCGLGGVSDGFALEGFDILGIDIIDMPSKGYKHNFIQADIRKLRGEDFRGFDVIWGSPPCRNFTQLPDHWIRPNGVRAKWKEPKNPEEGLKLVNAFLKFVEAAKPRFWIMENVYGLAKYFNAKPRIFGARLHLGKRHVFYGNFPEFLLPIAYSKMCSEKVQGINRSWIRAKIPLACSRAFAQSIKGEIDKSQ